MKQDGWQSFKYLGGADEALQYARAWVIEDHPEGGWRRWLSMVARWTWLLVRRAHRDRVFLRASGMAYMSLIALVPLLLLTFGLLDATGLLADDPMVIRELVFGSFLGNIEQVRDFLLPGLLQVDLATLGAVGIAGVLVVAVRLYILVEQTYCDVFSVPVDRPMYMRLLMFYAALTLAPVSIVATLVHTSQVVSELGVALAPGLPVMLLQAAVLLVALKGFPATTVRWDAALVGTVVSVLLLDIALRSFRLYLQLFAADDPLHVIYGSLGVLPVFLMWLYMAWVVVLFGVEIAALIQDYDAIHARELAMSEEQILHAVGIGPESALHVAVVVAGAFLRGEGTVDRAQVAERTGLSLRDVGELLAGLERDGLIVSSKAGWLMAVDPARVPLLRVLQAWRSTASAGEAAVLGEIRAELDRAVSGTLAEAVGRWEAGSEEATSTAS